MGQEKGGFYKRAGGALELTLLLCHAYSNPQGFTEPCTHTEENMACEARVLAWA